MESRAPSPGDPSTRNGISKSELAWLGRLKHQHVAAFADRHRLSYGWLLEGSGPEHRETPV
jgi:hypothetical protein